MGLHCPVLSLHAHEYMHTRTVAHAWNVYTCKYAYLSSGYVRYHPNCHFRRYSQRLIAHQPLSAPLKIQMHIWFWFECKYTCVRREKKKKNRFAVVSCMQHGVAKMHRMPYHYICDFPQKSPTISGSFAERILQLKASYAYGNLRHTMNLRHPVWNGNG